MKITDYQIVDHGVEQEQYFQGCGVCGFKFEHVATGIGDSPYKALEDALDIAAVDGHDQQEAVINTLSQAYDLPEDAEDAHHYVSIRYNVEATKRQHPRFPYACQN